MDLRVFPGRSDNQKFYVLGYSVMNKNDALVSKDGEFFPVPFADAYLFVNPERAQNYIDQNDLKKDNFTGIIIRVIFINIGVTYDFDLAGGVSRFA